ncbi:MAG: phosphotransferase, partial [Ginsengibacter sp.]
MTIAEKDILELYKAVGNAPVQSIEKLPQSGSDRIYYRLIADKGSYIITSNQNVQENLTFFNFSFHFRKKNCPVPEIFAVNDQQTLYIQEDLGDETLLSRLEAFGQCDYTYKLFQKSLKALAWLQIIGDKQFDYNWCITSKKFGKQSITSDMLYFKYYFLDTLKIPYDKEKLIDDFEAVGSYLKQVDQKYFMFRDFQSRNIMIKDDEVFFIDYQGGMKGALQY